ncbi:MAG: hypothetical protein CL557_12505 [Alphaproteobacteria bacterium]|nr:hypothetical protein [Alphaproteobacteria bacterium]
MKEKHMTTVDKWAVFADSPTVSSSSSKVETMQNLAEELDTLTKKREIIEERVGQIENELAHNFPEEAGELAQSTPKYEIICNRTERWSWDKDALEKHFGQGSVPHYIKVNMTVDKRQFQKLPHHEQDPLMFALTRKLDKAKIKVIRNV